MKKLQFLKAFAKAGILSSVFLLAACSDDEGGSSDGIQGGTNSYIEGLVDGTQFNSLEIQGQSLAVATSQGTGDARLIMMSGSDMATNNMVIIMLGINEVGEYTIDAEDDGSVLAYVPADSPSYDTSNCDGATGTLNITHIDDVKVEGTFTFTGKDDENCSATKVITSGSFRGVFMSN